MLLKVWPNNSGRPSIITLPEVMRTQPVRFSSLDTTTVSIADSVPRHNIFDIDCFPSWQVGIFNKSCACSSTLGIDWEKAKGQVSRSVLGLYNKLVPN